MHRPARFLSLLCVLVLAVAGCGGVDDAADAPAEPAAEDPLDSTVAVVGNDDLKWSDTTLSATAGEITVELTCGPAVNHDFVIEELDDGSVVECDPGETATGSVELEPGTYTFYCSIAGHRTAGMEGTLTVVEE